MTLGVVRRGDQWSVIWYGKPVLTKDTPTDVRAYHERDSVFPATGTIDQFFDEDLFVVYRDIGRYAAAEILAAPSASSCWARGATSQDQPRMGREELRALVTEAEWDGFTDGYLLHGEPPAGPSTQAPAGPDAGARLRRLAPGSSRRRQRSSDIDGRVGGSIADVASRSLTVHRGNRS